MVRPDLVNSAAWPAQIVKVAADPGSNAPLTRVETKSPLQPELIPPNSPGRRFVAYAQANAMSQSGFVCLICAETNSAAMLGSTSRAGSGPPSGESEFASSSRSLSAT